MINTTSHSSIGLVSLRKLVLNNNQLTQFPNLTSSAGTITHLYLSGNALLSLSAEETLHGLIYLQVTTSSISNVSELSMPNLKELRTRVVIP